MDPQVEAAVWRRVFAAMEEPVCAGHPEPAAPQRLDCPSVCRRQRRSSALPAAALLLCLCCRCRHC